MKKKGGSILFRSWLAAALLIIIGLFQAAPAAAG